MKKNKMMRIASVLLVAVLLSTCAISGTFAKFVSSQEATDKAKVATWDIDFAGNDTSSKDFVFDLFNTINDVSTGDKGALTNDDDVKDATSGEDPIIAPGTSGSFTIKLVNNSEVNAQCKVEFDNTLLNSVPLVFTYKVGGVAYTSGTYVDLAMDTAVEIVVTWEWPWIDTDESTLQGQTLTVKAIATVEQVN